MIAILAALLPFIPQVAKWIGGSNAESVATKVVGIAQTVTGAVDPSGIVPALQGNPDLVMKLQQAVLDNQVEIEKLNTQVTLAQIDADKSAVTQVNATMQAEAKADHWPTYTWRPFIGFTFGTYILSLIVLPLFHVQPVTLSSDLTFAIGGILGVASFFRGKAQADPRIQTDNRG